MPDRHPSAKTTRVGFIGTGDIAVPMGRALARAGHRVIVSTATLTLLANVSGWLGAQTGDDVQAKAYVSNLIAGFLRGPDRGTPGHLLAERAALATPGTLNLQMLEGVMADGGFDRLPKILDPTLASMTVDPDP